MEISMKLVYQYMLIFLNFQTTSNHLHPLQAENCDSNSRLVVDEEEKGKFRLEKVNIIVSDRESVNSIIQFCRGPFFINIIVFVI